MINKISVATPSFGTKVYSGNVKYNKISQLCAEKLDTNDDELRIGYYNKDVNTKNITNHYKLIEYNSENGTSDKLFVNFDIREPREQITDKIVKAYNILRKRENIVQGMKAMTALQFADVIDVNNEIDSLEEEKEKIDKKIQVLEARRHSLAQKAYTIRFIEEVKDAQEFLNDKTKVWANEEGIDVYTKNNYTSQEIADYCAPYYVDHNGDETKNRCYVNALLKPYYLDHYGSVSFDYKA